MNDIALLPHQFAFVTDRTTPIIGMVAGFGAGKSQAAFVKAVDLALYNIDCVGAIFEPTNALVKLIAQPRLEELLEQYGIPYDVHQVPVPTYTLHFAQGDSTIICLSAENFTRIIGFELAFAIVDEADTIPLAIADKMFIKIKGRIRKGTVRQLALVSTPESFNFMYKMFVEDARDDKKLIKAKTSDNVFLPAGYIDDLRKNYSPQLIEMYLNGNFVNLTSGNVYPDYDRTLSNSIETVESNPNHILRIGVDFNIRNMHALVSIVKDQNVHFVDQITGTRDTQSLAEAIKRKYPNRVIELYVDSSGKSEKTNSSQTDIAILVKAGFKVNYPAKNPHVVDRINSVNAMICNGEQKRRLFVNQKTCPALVNTFEKQTYDKQGNPDKTQGFDHAGDACGYLIHYLYPITGKPSIKVR